MQCTCVVAPTYPLFLPDAILGLLWPPLRGSLNWQGSTLHLGQQAVLHQLRPLEPRVAVHLHQAVDLGGWHIG